MAELKLGNKYECYNCGVKFYDLGKTNPICPQCGADQKATDEGEPPLVTQATRREKSVFADLDDDEEDDELGGLGDDLDDEDLEVDEELEGADLEDDEDEDEEEDDD